MASETTFKKLILQASEFKVVQAAFRALQFDDQAVESIWKLIAVILHLGNIEFDQHESNGETIATLTNQGDVKTIADLIQVNPDEVKQVLLTRVIAAHGEVNRSLFRNLTFMLDEMTLRNASKFAIIFFGI